MMLSIFLKAPNVALTEQEARALAEAAVNVQRHYPQFQAAQKTIDWVNLATLVAITYGTRIIAYSKARRDEKDALNVTGVFTAGQPQPMPGVMQ